MCDKQSNGRSSMIMYVLIDARGITCCTVLHCTSKYQILFEELSYLAPNTTLAISSWNSAGILKIKRRKGSYFQQACSNKCGIVHV